MSSNSGHNPEIPQELEGIYALFNRIDQNGDGLITLDELDAVFNRILADQLHQPHASQEELRKLFSKMDYNADHLITFSEFVLYFQSASKIVKNLDDMIMIRLPKEQPPPSLPTTDSNTKAADFEATRENDSTPAK